MSGGDAPIPFAVYYGYPSMAGGASSEAGAIAALADFPLVVLGDGLEQPSHPDHSATRRIITALGRASTRVYGYVDLGVTTQGLTPDVIEARLRAWAGLGAAGVLLDDAGHEYGVTVERLGAALVACHRHGLRALVNAGDPVDAFAPGLPYQAGDAYLFESFAVGDGMLLPANDWIIKSRTATRLRPAGVELWVLATTLPASELAAYVWWAALLVGADAVAVAPPNYGATLGPWLGAGRPSLPPIGTRYLDSAPHLSGDRYERMTDAGVLWASRNPQWGIANAGFEPRASSVDT